MGQRLRRVSPYIYADKYKEHEPEVATSSAEAILDDTSGVMKNEIKWVRRLIAVAFPLKDLRREYFYNVNTKDFSWDPNPSSEKDPMVFDEIKADKKSTFVVEGILDTEIFRDYIDVAVPEQGSEEFFSLRRMHSLKIRICGREATKEWKNFPKDAYAGHFYYYENEFQLDVDADPSHVEDFYLKAQAGHQVSLVVYLLSFQSEVDAALAPADARRTLIVDESTFAPAMALRVLDPERTSEHNEYESARPEPFRTGMLPTHVATPPSQINYLPTLTGIRTALWIVAGVLVIHLFRGF